MHHPIQAEPAVGAVGAGVADGDVRAARLPSHGPGAPPTPCRA